jgi:hypothetical protein
MAVRFVCPACWKVTEMPDSMAGQRARCPDCHATGPVSPRPADKPAEHAPPPAPRPVPAPEKPVLVAAPAPPRPPAPGYRCPFCGTAERWVLKPFIAPNTKLLILLVALGSLALLGGIAWRVATAENTSIAVAIICILLAATAHAMLLMLAIWLGWDRRQVCPECGTQLG